MSWCRWSTLCENNLTSSLYIYDDYSGGVTIHVSAMKRQGEENAPKITAEFTRETVELWLKQNEERDNWVKNNTTLVPIGLKYDGQSFYNLDKESIVPILDMLKNEGYNFPEYVYACVKEMENDDEIDQ
jgi:hypothetical protein